MNKPHFDNQPKVIIKDLRQPDPSTERDTVRRARRSSEEVTIINRPIPALRETPKKQGPALIIASTIGAVALLSSSFILYVKNSDHQSSEKAAATSPSTAMPRIRPTGNLAASANEIPQPAPSFAINPLPSTSADAEPSNPPEENSANSASPTESAAPVPKTWPSNNIPNSKRPFPRKSTEIIRETPF